MIPVETNSKFDNGAISQWERWHVIEYTACAERLRDAWDPDRCAPESPFYALAQGLLRYERAQLRFHQAHLAVAKTQLARVGVYTGTGGSAFATYLKRYEERHGELFPGLSAVAGPLNA